MLNSLLQADLEKDAMIDEKTPDQWLPAQLEK
jgi:hypothetical protein